MPAVYAHYLFGKKVYKALPEAEKKMVRQGKDAFLIGLHGPDLLFYYRPFGKNRINQQGTPDAPGTGCPVFFGERERRIREGS